MLRFLAILLVLGGLAAFLAVETQGVDRAFGGVLARFGQKAPGARAAEAPAPHRADPDWWEKEERPARARPATPPRGIGQGVRERVNDALEAGARRHGGG